MRTVTKLHASQLANLFGLQVARIIVARMLLRIRRLYKSRRDSRAQLLRRNGFLIIGNFLSEDIAKQVEGEFRLAVQNPRFVTKRVLDTAGMLRTSSTVTNGNARYFPATVSSFKNSPQLLDLIRDYDGQDSLDGPDLLFQLSFWRTETPAERPENIDDSDHTNTDIHSDSFHSIIKCFYFIKAVNIKDGPHVYYPKTHRLSASRLLFEYVNSIWWRRDSPRVPRWLERIFARDQEMMLVPANTLVIEDTFGFHRALKPINGGVREIVYLQYRSFPFSL